MSNYSFRAHAASDHRKWIAVTLAILFIIAVIVTGVLTDWFSNWNKYCLFGHNYGEDGLCVRCGEAKAGGEVEKVEPVVDDNGGMQSAQAANNGIRLMSAAIPREQFGDYGIMSIAESAQQLTAIIEPADATNKAVDWSIAWKNPSSAFASGKTVTDYVTVTPTEDGALTANVQCLQAFGEQIEIKCTSFDDTSKFATCNVDYKKRITGVTTVIKDSKGATSLTLKPDGSFEGSIPMLEKRVKVSASELGGDVVYTPTFGIGTVDNTATGSINISVSNFSGYVGNITCRMQDSACSSSKGCTHIKSIKESMTYTNRIPLCADLLVNFFNFTPGNERNFSASELGWIVTTTTSWKITVEMDGYTKEYTDIHMAGTPVSSVGGLTDLVF